MINIFAKDATVFNNNGLATLEPTECLFKPSINGVWQLDMVLPYDAEKKSDLIENDKILKVTGMDCITEQTNTYQLFRIYDFKKEDNYVSVIAYPIGLDARFDTYTDSIKLYDKTPAQAVNSINALSDKYTVSLESPQYWSNDPKSGEYTKANIISILNGEKGFVQTWGGEICYDNYSIKMEHHMGTYTPVDVRYGKNIIGMSYDMDSSNVVTRLYPKAKSGEILNGDTRYRLVIYNYVDADNVLDYPIPHIYAVDTPYSLVQLTDDGSAEYNLSSSTYVAIKNIVIDWLHNALTGAQGVDTQPLLDNIELGWIVNNYALTMEKDGVQGIVEYFAQKVFNNGIHNIQAGAVKNLIFSAMKAGFDEVLTNTESGSYIGSSSKKLWEDHSVGQDPVYFYSYTWDSAGEFRVNVLGEADYAWVYASSKWNQLDNDGYTTGATDKTKWKWYKVKGKTYKRYGNKKKGRYLKDQWWEINDVWYKFTSGGQGIKGAALMSDCLDIIEEMEVRETTLVDSLVEIAYTAERELFELLYTQMTEYCENMFDNDKLSYPIINIDINFADLSQTVEYQNYSFLEKIHLGDSVNIRNDKLGVLLTERIIGLTYDVLRNCNTEIHIGLTESSVVNLLDSIGKTDNQVKFVAGDGITIENNVISVNAPEKPYLEDVKVNGNTVVRNHIAYIDLDEMGIDESIDVLYGEEAPDDDEDGQPKDFYLQLQPLEDVIDESKHAHTTVDITNFEKADEKYNISLEGTGQSSVDAVTFPLDGLIEGNEYTISFNLQFNTGIIFDYSEYGNWAQMIESSNPQTVADLGGSWTVDPDRTDAVVFERDTSSHSYNFTFTATATNHNLCFAFQGVRDNLLFSLSITNLEVSGDLKSKITDLYNKSLSDIWMKYIPHEMIGATSSTDGESGTVPRPTIADKDKVLKGDGTWGTAGAEVSITPTLQSGTKIADYEINGVAGVLYAPKGITTGLAWKNLTQLQYDALSTAEKNNGTIYFISDNATGVEGKTYIYISKSDYDSLSTEEKNNNIPYFVYEGGA